MTDYAAAMARASSRQVALISQAETLDSAHPWRDNMEEMTTAQLGVYIADLAGVVHETETAIAFLQTEIARKQADVQRKRDVLTKIRVRLNQAIHVLSEEQGR